MYERTNAVLERILERVLQATSVGSSPSVYYSSCARYHVVTRGCAAHRGNCHLGGMFGVYCCRKAAVLKNEGVFNTPEGFRDLVRWANWKENYRCFAGSSDGPAHPIACDEFLKPFGACLEDAKWPYGDTVHGLRWPHRGHMSMDIWFVHWVDQWGCLHIRESQRFTWSPASFYNHVLGVVHSSQYSGNGRAIKGNTFSRPTVPTDLWIRIFTHAEADEWGWGETCVKKELYM
ncbi:hypothetical protein EDC04DRAFT_2613335 [Pisolithus marmoratus]|nr:hypothetical protein EDC04DRAFT_2613335 [Pisolithus marmoratus]